MAIKLGINVENMSPAKKNLLLVLPSALIIGLAVYFLIMPALEERKNLLAEIQKQNSEIQEAQKSTIKLPALMAEHERLKIRFAELQLQLPEEREISGLLRQVSDLGVKSGLFIAAWKPANRNIHPSREVYEIPVNVEMRGNYHRFGQFFSNITKINRIVNILNVNIKVIDARTAALGVSFSAMTYSMIPEAERKAMEEPKKKK
jgi:type IV pilus assembly protein PilO